MKIDKRHWPWFWFSVVVLVGSVLAYMLYVPRLIHGASGGNALGIVLGSVALAFLLFAAGLFPRRLARTERFGRAKWWMAGHLWLGTLTLPLAWLHGGFRHGGALTAVVMWLLYAIVFTGVVCAILQHIVPRSLKADARVGLDYFRFAEAMDRLRAEARRVVESARGPATGRVWEQGRDRNITIAATAAGDTAPMARTAVLETATARAEPVAGPAGDGSEHGWSDLLRFYDREVVPFLAGRAPRESNMPDPKRASLLFKLQREDTPQAFHETLDQLERICDDARLLHAQRRVHRWLHGWLLVHVPLAFALVILVLVHAVVALHYK